MLQIVLNGWKAAAIFMSLGLLYELFFWLLGDYTLAWASTYISLVALAGTTYLLRKRVGEFFYRFFGLVTLIPIGALVEGGLVRLMTSILFMAGAVYMIFIWHSRERKA